MPVQEQSIAAVKMPGVWQRICLVAAIMIDSVAGGTWCIAVFNSAYRQCVARIGNDGDVALTVAVYYALLEVNGIFPPTSIEIGHATVSSAEIRLLMCQRGWAHVHCGIWRGASAAKITEGAK